MPDDQITASEGETVTTETPPVPVSEGEQPTVESPLPKQPDSNEKVAETPKVEAQKAPEVKTVDNYIDNNKGEGEVKKAIEKPTETPPTNEAESKLSVIEKIAKDSLIKSSNVHEDLLDLLPDDLEKLANYLESDKFKKANSKLHNLQKQQASETTKTTSTTAPKETVKEVPKPKTFGDISVADQVNLGSLLKGIYK